MTTRIGGYVVACLELAGERHLKEPLPHIHQQFLLQVGGTKLLHRYDATPAYWHRVQAILDCFFTSAQRAEVCGWLLRDAEILARPEFAWFRWHALAERGVQALSHDRVFRRKASARSAG